MVTSPDIPSTDFPTSPESRRTSGAHRRQRRVALACQRCKNRKQRCDGAQPACLACSKTGNQCLYVASQAASGAGRREHVKALEERVAQLETSLALHGASDVGDDHFRIATLMAQDTDSVDDGNEVFIAVRDLSLAASGHYVGGTSNIAIGRVLNSVVQSQQQAQAVATSQSEEVSPAVEDSRLNPMVDLTTMDEHTADRLIHGWYRHIATRYPVIHTSEVKRLHESRANLASTYEMCILHLIYAVSGRWLESAGETGYFFSDKHYDVAFKEIDANLKLRDSRSLDYLILMTLYCTRAPREPGAWTYIGMAIRLCIELGLHRSRKSRVSLEGEMAKRRFWTAYFLERDICIAIGRPPSISDHDIDAELPLDIDESADNAAIIAASSTPTPTVATSLTPFIHRTRLKQIESEVQHTIYRVDKPASVSDAIITDFLGRLEEWQSQIPQEAITYAQPAAGPYDGLEFYTIHYYRCVRFLLYPQLTTTSSNLHYLRLCADACQGIIRDYRRLHQVFPVGFSALSIQSVFLAGLTLIYCTWLAPPSFLASATALSDCQLLLYVIAERHPSAKKYRDIFERLRATVIDLVEAGKHRPGHPVTLDFGMQQDFAGMESSWPYGMSSDFTQIISTMTANDFRTHLFHPTGQPMDGTSDSQNPSWNEVMNTDLQPYGDQPYMDI
jgi:hypothetical protein